MRLFEQGDRISKTLGWKLHTWKTMVQGFLSYKCFDFVFRVTVILLHWYFSHRRKIYTWYMCVSLFSNGSQLESTMSLASLNAWHHVLKWEALLSPIQSAPISKDLQFSFRLVFFFFSPKQFDFILITSCWSFTCHGITYRVITIRLVNVN